MRIRINFQGADLVKVTDGKRTALINRAFRFYPEDTGSVGFIRIRINRS
jgi:hypothetical protein